MKTKKKEDYKESQVTTMTILGFTFFIRNYTLLKKIVVKDKKVKVLFTITFYLEFLCIVEYLKHSNDTPKPIYTNIIIIM